VKAPDHDCQWCRGKGEVPRYEQAAPGEPATRFVGTEVCVCRREEFYCELTWGSDPPELRSGSVQGARKALDAAQCARGFLGDHSDKVPGEGASLHLTVRPAPMVAHT
jgi:hypothetical protein